VIKSLEAQRLRRGSVIVVFDSKIGRISSILLANLRYKSPSSPSDSLVRERSPVN